MTASQSSAAFDRVLVVGAGIVGQAIAEVHLREGCCIEIVDLHPESLERIVDGVKQLADASSPEPFATGGWLRRLTPKSSPAQTSDEPPSAASSSTPSILILESILERLEPKRQLIAAMAEAFGKHALIASNTSSLRIAEIAVASPYPHLVAGLHFFMPVGQRPMVEVIAGPTMDRELMERLKDHARRIGKQPLEVGDSPGFVVNRMLWPYLNNSLHLLQRGADHQQIRRAAQRVGMPLSPLELMDVIGLRTAFDSGRLAWQAFPKRLEPSPVLPGLIKRGQAGRIGGGGFYAYDEADRPSAELTETAAETIGRYQHANREWNDQDVYLNLLIPMLIEASLILSEGLVEESNTIDAALRGGLGFQAAADLFTQADQVGEAAIRETIDRDAPVMKAMRPRDWTQGVSEVPTFWRLPGRNPASR